MVKAFEPKPRFATTCTVSVSLLRLKPEAVTLTEPKSKPVITGCESGVVDPWKKATLDGVIVSLDGSLLDKLMKMKPAAGCAKLTFSGIDFPTLTVTPEAKIISAVCLTLTFAVVSGRLLGVLEWAVMDADPTDTPVTGTVTLVPFGGKTTLEGTVATPVLLEVMLTVRPPDGPWPPERLSVRFPVAVTPTVRFDGVKPIVPFTCTSWLAAAIPVAEALMFADPKLPPITMG
jgi:hypothetical protein